MTVEELEEKVREPDFASPSFSLWLNFPVGEERFTLGVRAYLEVWAHEGMMAVYIEEAPEYVPQPQRIFLCPSDEGVDIVSIGGRFACPDLSHKRLRQAIAKMTDLASAEHWREFIAEGEAILNRAFETLEPLGD